MTFNLLDTFIGGMMAAIILCTIWLWIKRVRAGAPISKRSLALWAGWGVQFLVYEAWAVVDGDPTTLTLSEMLVGTVPLWAMLAGTWCVCGALLLHWWDLDRRLLPLQKINKALNEDRLRLRALAEAGPAAKAWKWKREWPTAPGWYFARFSSTVDIVRVSLDGVHGLWCMGAMGLSCKLSECKASWWSDPIPTPVDRP